MDNIINFLYVFFNGDFFVVIIVALILILAVVLFGLVKTQREYEKLLEEKESKKEEIEKTESVEESNKLVEENINESLKEEKIVKENVEPILEIENTKEINPIEAYELDEEANAVISTKELESIEKERDELYGAENNAKLIEEYETEQENKAIISYSELLKNANSLELEYIEKPKEDEEAPVVKQVEVKQSFKGVTYVAEEEYLKLLKELRKNLTLNG